MARGIRLTAATGGQYAPRVTARRRVSGFRRLAAVVVVGLAPIPVCAAPTFTVNTAFDAPDASPDGVCETAKGNGVCTLRAAIMEADRTSGATVAVPALPAGKRYLLTQGGSLTVTMPMTIVGGGATGTIVDANQTDRVFNIALSTGAPTGTVMISGMTITGGQGDRSPGGTCAAGLLGGSMYGGGGLAISSPGPVTLDRVVVVDNASPSHGGGGIEACAFPLAVVDSVILNNQAGPVDCCDYGGGGILSFGPLTVQGSSIVGNSVQDTGFGDRTPGISGAGGGIYYGTRISTSLLKMTLINSTISGNSAHFGGAVATFGSADIANVTIVSNTAGGSNRSGIAGGIELEPSPLTVRIWNSIVAKNTAGVCMPGHTCPPFMQVPSDCEAPDPMMALSTLISRGYNIFSSVSSCSSPGSLDILGDPLVGALADNGGPTPTAALLPGSPATDAGDPAGCADFQGFLLTTDQRGEPRPVGPRCDIGAYEVQPPTTTTTTLPGTGCAHAATLPSVDCRLAALRILVTSKVPAGALQTQLLGALTQTRGKTSQVEALRAAGKKRPARSALGRAISALGSFTHRLKSRAARHLGSIKATLLSRAADLVRDLRILRHG